jgi:ABC-2 type transport system permease protein
VIADILRLELRRSRGLAVWLSMTAFVYSAVIAAFYPAITKNLAFIDTFLEQVPKGLLVSIGLDASFANPGVYYTSNVGIFVWPIVAAIAAIAIATRPAADTERGWIELPLAGRVNRTGYLLAVIAVEVGVLALLAFVTVAGVVIGGAVVGVTFDGWRFMLAGVAAWVWALPFAAAATLITVVTMSRGVSAAAVAGTLVLMYLLRVIVGIEPSLDWAGTLSAFQYLYPTPIIDRGTFPAGEALLFGGIALGAWGAALRVFRRRDLLA